MQAWATHVLGESYDFLGKADSALIYFEKSIEIKRTLNDVDGEASSNIGIGMLYFYQKDLSKAESYFNNALTLYTKVNNEKRMGAALNNLGAVYRNQHQYDKAIQTYNHAYDLKVKTNDSVGMFNALANLGTAYQYLKQYDKAEKYLLQSQELQQKIKSKNNQITNFAALAQLKMEQGKYAESKKYLDQGVEVGKTLDQPHEMMEIYQVYAALDTLTNDYKSAYQHLRLQNDFQKKITQADRQKEMDKLEVIYQTKEKEKEIQLSKTTIQNRNKTLWIVSGISALLLLLAFWLFWLRSKLHKSNNRLNSLVKEKEDLVKEIHHRVKNNLQVISSLLNMHVRKVQDPQSKKIFDDGISRIQAMSLIHQNIYSHSSLQELQPKEYVEKLIQQLFITYQIPDKSVQINTSIAEMNMDIEKLMSLGLILNEILSNAFKYAFNGSKTGTIDILMHPIKDDQVELIVKDSGSGISIQMIDAPGDSLGMRLIQAFSDKLNATLSIGNVSGTVYKLTFDPTR
ncbi:MAG: tetratricopeptide repeat protein [Chitinophagaceae bacterium]|nr:tetratricopeptide repeat protein [Chitinophagaceae bacterium]